MSILKQHIKIYLDAFGYDETDYIPSEIGGKAVDIHHIVSRGMGGTKEKDRIENLMALTREQHLKYGDKKIYMKMLLTTHWCFLERHGVEFDREYLRNEINKYHENNN